jgi:hypothetical protein
MSSTKSSPRSKGSRYGRPTFRGSWETDAFITLLRNTIACGMRA